MTKVRQKIKTKAEHSYVSAALLHGFLVNPYSCESTLIKKGTRDPFGNFTRQAVANATGTNECKKEKGGEQVTIYRYFREEKVGEKRNRLSPAQIV